MMDRSIYSKDITGNKYGKLTAIRFAEKRITGNNAKYLWLYKCDCGSDKIANKADVNFGSVRSCGCAKTKHGYTRNGKIDPTYKSWQNAKGSGVNICDSWLSFESFLKDMGKKPSNDYQLYRINNDGDYEPNNCKWSTKKEQANIILPPLLL